MEKLHDLLKDTLTQNGYKKFFIKVDEYFSDGRLVANIEILPKHEN